MKSFSNFILAFLSAKSFNSINFPLFGTLNSTLEPLRFNNQLDKKSEILQFSYLTFIFYTLLYWYTLFDLSERQSGANVEFIKSCNEIVYDYLSEIYKYNIKEYD